MQLFKISAWHKFLLTGILLFLLAEHLFSQKDTLYFFDFENIQVQQDSTNRLKFMYSNSGLFQNTRPYFLNGKTVNFSLYNDQAIQYSGYDVGKRYLFHSPSKYKPGYKGVAYNHIELELLASLPAGKYYKISFLIANLESSKYIPQHYGVKFSGKRIIKKNPGSLLSNPDIFFKYNDEAGFTRVQAIFYAKTAIRYVYFGCFAEDTVRLEKKIEPVKSILELQSDSFALVDIIKPTGVILDNILVQELTKYPVEFRDIYFPVNSDQVQGNADIILINQIADYLAHNPQMKILIQVYAHQAGLYKTNLDLAERRKEYIKKLFLCKNVSLDQIFTFGKAFLTYTSSTHPNSSGKISFIFFE